MLRRTVRPPCRHGGVSRRRFLATLGATAAGFVVGPTGLVFGRGGGFDARARVAVATATDYEPARVQKIMEALFDGIGGIADIVRPGDRVGIKINLTGGLWNAQNFQNQTSLPPGDTFWTHPEVLRAVGTLIRDAGASQIYVLEASGDEWGAYAQYGYTDAAQAFGGTYVDLNEVHPYTGFATRSTGTSPFIYQSFTQNAILNDLDCVVSLAKSKQHAEAGVTHGMKNLVGSVPLSRYSAGQGSRQALHRHTSHDGDTHSNLCRVIMDLNTATPIRLVVNDAVKTVLGGEGPWHRLTPANFDAFVVSKDPVAADAVATQVMGFDPTAGQGSATFPQSLNYFQLAEQLGMGIADPHAIDVVHVQATGAEEEETPGPVQDLAIYPNPFHDRMVVDVTLRSTAPVLLSVYDVRGRLMATLARRSFPIGKSTLEWSGLTDHGQPAPSGAYLVVLESEGVKVTRKVARVRV